ncbi:MAG: rhomboid family intramembrane serine protease [Actinomycetota bacterium]
MIPLRDENPTRRTPFVTVVVMAACVAAFVFVQPSATRSVVDDPTNAELIEEIEFSYEYAAIPCELTQGRPLTIPEIQRTLAGGDADACLDEDAVGRALFPDKSVWRAVVVSMFLHGGWLHLAGNMIFLWVFGNNIEDHLGALRYLAFYLAAGVVATAAHVFLALDSTVPLVGASGAIAGVMGAYLVWFPWARVRTLILLGFIPLWPRIPAAVLLVIWFGTQFLIDPNSGVAWAAHVGGFVFGAAVGVAARRDPGFRNRLWAQRYRATGSGPWNNRTGPDLTHR